MSEQSKIALLSSNSDANIEDKWTLQFIESLKQVLGYLNCSFKTLDVIDSKELSNKNYDIYLIVLTQESADNNEIKVFVESLNENSGDKKDILFLLKDPSLLQRRIKFIEQYISFPLFHYDNHKRQYQLFQFDNRENNEESAWLNVLDIGYEIKCYLNKHAYEAASSKQTIFLAATTPDQEFYRQNLKRELQHWGFNVLPESFLPSDYSELKELLYSYLERSSLTIHILGNQYGEILQGTNKSIIDLQNEIVAEFINNTDDKHQDLDHTFRFIWINPDSEVIENQQHNYIEKLKQDMDFLRGTEIIQTPLELFKSSIKSKLNLILSDNYNENNTKKEDSKIYLIAEDYSAQFVKEIEQALTNHGIGVLKLEKKPAAGNLYSLHKKYLLDAKGVIVYCEGHNIYWLKSKLSDILKAPGFGKSEPFNVKGLIIPEELNTDQLSMVDDLTILNKKESDRSYSFIEPFIQQFRKKEL
jgi:spore germination protein GerM